MNEIPKISAIMIAEFQYNELTKVVNIIEDKKEWINRYIDKAKFDEYKNKHYNLLGNPETITGKREIIAEELNIENIGEYKDLGIDEQLFVNFNNQFNTITKIENSINENTEDDLVKFFW